MEVPMQMSERAAHIIAGSITPDGAVHLLDSALTHGTESMSMLELASKILCELSHYTTKVKGIVSAGGVSLLVTTMISHPGSEVLVENALSGLNGLARNNMAITRSVVAAGGIPALFAALSRHAESPDVMKDACHLLHTISQHTASAKQLILAGGIPALMATLTNHADFAELVDIAFAALHSLSIVNDKSCAAVATAGGFSALVAALVRHGDNEDVVRSCCVLLHCMCFHAGRRNDVHQVALARAGGIPALLAALACQVGDDDTTAGVCSSLACLGVDGVGALKTLQGGGVARVVWTSGGFRPEIAAAAQAASRDSAWATRFDALLMHQTHWAIFATHKCE